MTEANLTLVSKEPQAERPMCRAMSELDFKAALTRGLPTVKVTHHVFGDEPTIRVHGDPAQLDVAGTIAQLNGLDVERSRVFPRQMDVTGFGQPVAIETEPRTCSITERDARWSLLALTIAPFLYEAMQADALGVIDHIPYDEATPAIRRLCVSKAEVAVRRMSSLAVSEAQRKTTLHRDARLAEVVSDAVACAGLTTGVEKFELRNQLNAFLRMLKISGLLEQEPENYERCLVEPFLQSESAQRARALTSLVQSEVR